MKRIKTLGGDIYMANDVDDRLADKRVTLDAAVTGIAQRDARIAELESEVRELILANTALKAEIDYYTD